MCLSFFEDCYTAISKWAVFVDDSVDSEDDWLENDREILVVVGGSPDSDGFTPVDGRYGVFAEYTTATPRKRI